MGIGQSPNPRSVLRVSLLVYAEPTCILSKMVYRINCFHNRPQKEQTIRILVFPTSRTAKAVFFWQVSHILFNSCGWKKRLVRLVGKSKPS